MREDAKRLGSKIQCGFHQVEIELFRCRIERKDCKRKIGIDHHKEHRKHIVEKLRFGFEKGELPTENPVCIVQNAGKPTFRVEEDTPCEHANQKARPKGQNDQADQYRAPARARTGERVCARQSDRNAQKGCDEGKPNCPPDDGRIIGV